MDAGQKKPRTQADHPKNLADESPQWKWCNPKESDSQRKWTSPVAGGNEYDRRDENNGSQHDGHAHEYDNIGFRPGQIRSNGTNDSQNIRSYCQPEQYW